MKKKSRVKAKSKPAKKLPKTKTKAKSRKPSARQTAPKRPPKRPKKAEAKPEKTPPRKGVIAPLNGVLLGFVEDYFAHVGVMALTLKGKLSVGQRIQVLGHTTNFEQAVESMQIDYVPVTQAGSGDSVGVKIAMRARTRDHVYLLK